MTSEWEDESHLIEEGIMGEFPYVIWENHMGYLCGYLGVPPTHPWYEKDYNDEAVSEVEVHGGLTYTGYGEETGMMGPYGREDIKAWWLGFDCGHGMDLPRAGTMIDLFNKDFEERHPEFKGMDRGTYKDRDYVYKEIEGLAKQAAEILSSTD